MSDSNSSRTAASSACKSDMDAPPVTADKHTPGPWIVDEYGDVTANAEDVARIASTNPADARLIAAAPELLKACRLALAEAESWIHDQLDGTRMLDGALAHLESARAAIAKATGDVA